MSEPGAPYCCGHLSATEQVRACRASSNDEAMPLEEAVRIAAGVRHRPDGTSRAFDALLTELDRLHEQEKRWAALTGRREEGPPR